MYSLIFFKCGTPRLMSFKNQIEKKILIMHYVEDKINYRIAFKRVTIKCYLLTLFKML